MRIGLLVLVLVVLAGAVAYWTVGAEDGAPAVVESGDVSEPSDETSDPEFDSATSALDSRLESEGAGSTVPRETASGTDRRHEAPPLALFARVESEDGSPIVGAVASWVAVPDRLPDTRSEALVLVRSEGRVGRSDARGEVRFESAPTGAVEGASVLWVTHSRFGAAQVDLEPARDRAVSETRIVLVPVTGVRARVTDARDRPVVGAAVVQWALEDGSQSPETSGVTRLLVRESRTDETGTADLASLPGEQEVVATSADGSSAPWRGVAETDLDLRIATTFHVVGRVLREAELDPAVEVTIDCHAVVGHRKVELASLSGVTTEWGPLELPVIEADEYVFTLDGPGIVPFEAGLVRPAAGETRDVELRATFGEVLWLLATNEEDEILHDAVSETEWIANGRRTTTFFEPRDDGFFFIEGLPAGLVRPTLRCEGYATMRVDEIAVPEENPITHEFTMRRAVTLGGRVLADGEPVEDFQVTYWPPQYPKYALERVVTGAEDGRFEFDDVPREETTLVVTSRGVGTSAPVTVDLGAGSVRDLTVELTTGISARGQVVDAVTGVPVAGAEARLWVTDGKALLSTVGPPSLTSSSGEFELGAVPAGQATVLVSAEGYGSGSVDFTGVEAGRVDVGVVPLSKRKVLEVRLLHDADQDPTLWMCGVTGSDSGGWHRFDASGLARIEGAGAGLQAIHLYSSGSITRWFGIELRPGDDWTTELDIRGSSELRVEIATPEGERVAPSTIVRIRSHDQSAQAGMYAEVDEAGGVTFDALLPGSYQVEAREPATEGDAILAVASVEVDRGEARTVLLHPGASWPVLRVTNELGEPLAGVRVTVAVPGRAQRWSSDALTDTAGLLELRGLATDRIVVALSHPEVGQRLGVDLDVRDQSRPVEVVLSAGATARFVLRDHRGPVAGVEARLSDPGRNVFIRGTFSDDSGLLRFDRIAPGDYLFFVSDEDYFYARVPVTVVLDGPPLDVRLHRACDLEILTTTEGLPRPNVALELIRVETGDRLASYLRDGQIGSDSDEIRTDGTGRLGLRGVPEGELRWRVEANGEVREGSYFVRPDSTAPLVVEVP